MRKTLLSPLPLPLPLPRSLLLACAVLITAAHALAQPAAVAELEPPADPGVPFLVMRQTPGELAGAPPRVLRVFGDGRCELERPAMMRGAGTHRWTLPPAELQALLRQVRDAGVADLDVQALRRSLRRAEADDASETVTYRLDDDIVDLELRLDRYRSARGVEQRGFEKRLRLTRLRADRDRQPNDEAVRLLSELRDSLDAMERVHAPVPEPGS